MIDPDRLDYAAARRQPIRAGLAASPQTVMASVIGGVMALVALVLVAVGTAQVLTDRGLDPALVLWALFLGGGATWVLRDVRRVAARGSAATAFAAANGMHAVPAAEARDYASAALRSGAAWVDRAVRSPGRDFVEVGNILRLGEGSTPSTREIYLRARLVGGAVEPTAVVTPDVSGRLDRLGGPWTIETSDHELVATAPVELDFTSPGQLRHAFAAVAGLAVANSRVMPTDTSDAAPVLVRRPLRWWQVVVGTLAVLVVVPTLFALVMSGLDDGPTWIAVGGVIVFLAIAPLGVRWAVRRIGGSTT